MNLVLVDIFELLSTRQIRANNFFVFTYTRLKVPGKRCLALALLCHSLVLFFFLHLFFNGKLSLSHIGFSYTTNCWFLNIGNTLATSMVIQ